MLQSLECRALLEKTVTEKGDSLFTLQPVVMRYAIAQFVEQVCQDISAVLKSAPINKLGLLRSHKLVNDREQDGELRASQIRLIITPIKNNLYLNSVGEICIQVQLKQWLTLVECQHPQLVGYAKENILSLLDKSE